MENAVRFCINHSRFVLLFFALIGLGLLGSSMWMFGNDALNNFAGFSIVNNYYSKGFFPDGTWAFVILSLVIFTMLCGILAGHIKDSVIVLVPALVNSFLVGLLNPKNEYSIAVISIFLMVITVLMLLPLVSEYHLQRNKFSVIESIFTAVENTLKPAIWTSACLFLCLGALLIRFEKYWNELLIIYSGIAMALLLTFSLVPALLYLFYRKAPHKKVLLPSSPWPFMYKLPWVIEKTGIWVLMLASLGIILPIILVLSPEKTPLSSQGTHLEFLLTSLIFQALAFGFILRSFRFFLISTVLISFPVSSIQLLLYYMDLWSDLITTLISASVLAIMTNYTFQIFFRFRNALGIGWSWNEAINNSIAQSGYTMVIFSFMLPGLFTFFIISTWSQTVVGLLVSLVCASALLINLFVLPVLVRMFRPKVYRRNTSPEWLLYSEDYKAYTI